MTVRSVLQDRQIDADKIKQNMIDALELFALYMNDPDIAKTANLNGTALKLLRSAIDAREVWLNS